MIFQNSVNSVVVTCDVAALAQNASYFNLGFTLVSVSQQGVISKLFITFTLKAFEYLTLLTLPLR